MGGTEVSARAEVPKEHILKPVRVVRDEIACRGIENREPPIGADRRREAVARAGRAGRRPRDERERPVGAIDHIDVEVDVRVFRPKCADRGEGHKARIRAHVREGAATAVDPAGGARAAIANVQTPAARPGQNIARARLEDHKVAVGGDRTGEAAPGRALPTRGDAYELKRAGLEIPQVDLRVTGWVDAAEVDSEVRGERL